MNTKEHKLSILIIDDEEELLDSLQLLLSSRFNITTASNAIIAYDLLNKNPLDHDIIITDMTMKKMSGMDFYSKIKATHPGVEKRMIFMTGNIYSEHIHEFINKIDNPVLEKPFNIADLLKTIQRIVNKSSDIVSG